MVYPRRIGGQNNRTDVDVFGPTHPALLQHHARIVPIPQQKACVCKLLFVATLRLSTGYPVGNLREMCRRTEVHISLAYPSLGHATVGGSSTRSVVSRGPRGLRDRCSAVLASLGAIWFPLSTRARTGSAYAAEEECGRDDGTCPTLNCNHLLPACVARPTNQRCCRRRPVPDRSLARPTRLALRCPHFIRACSLHTRTCSLR